MKTADLLKKKDEILIPEKEGGGTGDEARGVGEAQARAVRTSNDERIEAQHGMLSTSSYGSPLL